ncbi:MAG TPA: isoprenylcysteine carboxylmethyltransferase family protein [Vicinamibacterales bacterium]|jgi:protein-S-isoprenylcysteine O-methyltransferase Ste14
MVRLGGWLFKRRTWLPLPLALALLLIPSTAQPTLLLELCGAGLVASGELLRLWGVRHIGVISRTRSERLGPLVDGGPFGYVRNPLYLGNIALWVGFAINAGLIWLAPILALVLGFEYHAIARWEEGLLESRLGAPYREYSARVPRWLPRFSAAPARQTDGQALELFSWRETLFSERGTLLAIAVGYLLIVVKLFVE